MTIMKLSADEIKAKVKNHSLTVSVIGLGWMGLPTACLFGEAGSNVIGVDSNPEVVEKLNRGESYFAEPGLPQLLKRLLSDKRLRATNNIQEAASQSDAIILLVPTLIDKQRFADYSAVENSCRDIGKGIQSGCLLIFESTCGPGVTERVVKSTLEKYSGLKAGVDFGLAYSPIRAMGGRALRDIQSYPRVVGAIDEKSLEAASALLSTIVKGEIVKVRDIKTAEASKLFETIYRDVNIALANEFAVLCEKAGIDYDEAREAVNTLKEYCHLHIAGVGVGGHCLPVYPYLLAGEAERLEARLKLVLNAREINDGMPSHTARLVADGLRASGRSMKGSKVVVLGISYRANVKETRFSPSIELITLLKRRGARVVVFDPKFSATEIADMGYATEPTLKACIEKANCVVITVSHDEFRRIDARELAASVTKSAVIVDCAHMLSPLLVEKAGLIYRGIGRGVWTR